MGEHLRFLWTFLRSPVATGAVAPSSPGLARRMVEEAGIETAETVVELGPGTGPFTRAILDRIGPRTFFLAMELNPEFAAGLSQRFPGLTVVNDSAERLPDHLKAHGRAAADTILCGLPWAGFSRDHQERLMGAVVDSLRPGGRFATFAYIHACWLPPGRRLRRLLRSRFSHVERSRIVWRNLPPAFVYRCRK
jgi:phosphatidylethanolamine/phosphatidyl-N-methylethanolamine N-methyltransferase